MSKLLTDNIDTFIGIAKGKEWQIQLSGTDNWMENSGVCPVHAISNGYKIRLAPEKKWVDFSRAPEKRTKGKCIVIFKRYSVPVIVQYVALMGQWEDGGGDFYSDSELFRDCDWHHEDGTVTPFGVEVEG